MTKFQWKFTRRAWLVLAAILVLPLVARAHAPATSVDPEREAILAQAQQDPVLQRIIELGRNDNQVMEHLDYLTNHIGPRLSGSVRLKDAGEWALSLLESWGYETELEVAGTLPVRFERGPWQGKMVEPEEMAFEFGTPSWGAGTTGKERGPALVVPAGAEEFAAVREQVRDAWAVVPRGTSGQALSRLRNRLEEAGARGAITRHPERISVLGRPPSSYEDRPKLPDIRLRDIYYDRIVERLEAGQEVVLEFDIRNYSTPGPAPYYNALAWIRGTEFPDEYVIFGAHLDSYCGATGTIDNGVGSMANLEAARILAAAGARPRRTIMIALWGGEEQGLRGSRSWVRRNRDKLDNVSAYFNIDSGTNAIVGTSGSAEMRPYLRQALEPINLINPDRSFNVGVSNNFGSARGGSDHAAFQEQGVPGFSWQLRGPAVYNVTWHTNLDTYDRALPDHLQHSAAAIAVGVYGTANLDEKMTREGMVGGGR